MSISRRTLGGLAIATVALSACGGESTPGGPQTSAKGPRQVTLWGDWSDTAVKPIQDMCKRFSDSQPDYEVKYVVQKELEQKLLTGMASGQVPDVVIWDRYKTSLYAPKRAFLPIDDLVAQDNVDLKQYYEQALGELKVDGKLYGLPYSVDNRSLFYNERMLAEAGVEPPTTWDELLSVAVKTTKRQGKKLLVSGFALDDIGLFSMWIGQAGGKMVTDDGQKVAFNSPEGLQVLEFWRKLMDEGVYELGFGKGGMPFPEGKVATMYSGPWAFGDLDKVKALKYGVSEPPAGPRGDKAAGMGGHGLVIPSGTKNKQGAWAFLKWMVGEKASLEYGKMTGIIPGNRTAANDPFYADSPKFGAIVRTMDYAAVRPATKGYSDVENKALFPQLQKFMSKQGSAEQALGEAEKMGNQLLADNRR